MYRLLQKMRKTFCSMTLLAVDQGYGTGRVRRSPSSWRASLSLLNAHVKYGSAVRLGFAPSQFLGRSSTSTILWQLQIAQLLATQKTCFFLLRQAKWPIRKLSPFRDFHQAFGGHAVKVGSVAERTDGIVPVTEHIWEIAKANGAHGVTAT